MNRFDVLRKYTRSEVADIIEMPEERRRGGAWSTGYDEWQGGVFIFANVGVAGRTGHDYGNRWVGKNLVWFGKTWARRGQAQIDRIISNTVPVHIFWRGMDRAPFTYAGMGIAIEATDDAPIQVTWSFENDAMMEPIGELDNSGSPSWRRGPSPTKGQATFTRADGDTEVYLLCLADDGLGILDLPEGYCIIKIGISNKINRRIRELNIGFPPGSKIGWKLISSRRMPNARDAWELEGRCLENLRQNGYWIGGEYGAVPGGLLKTLLRDDDTPEGEN